MVTERVETTTGICFGNRGPLRRDYNVEELKALLGIGESEAIFPDKPPPQTNVFRRGGPLRRLFSTADFEIMFGRKHEEKFPENGSQNGKGGEIIATREAKPTNTTHIILGQYNPAALVPPGVREVNGHISKPRFPGVEGCRFDTELQTYVPIDEEQK